ncbi:MAG: OmpA family protein [Bernardetiaceae bacterium]
MRFLYVLFCFCWSLNSVYAQRSYRKVILGPEINSPYAEGQAVISADGQTLFVYRVGHPSNVGARLYAGDEDIWYAERQADGSFGKLRNIGPPLNTADNNAVFGISGDGQTLFLYDQYDLDETSINITTFAISKRTRKGWSKPKSIAVKGFRWREGLAWLSISVDKQVLLVAYHDAKDRRGEGEQDLYVAFAQDDGTYGPLKNLGPDLNTTGMEASPFLAADNKTLYFASNGHGGYGSLDIFRSERLDDTWTNWSPPQNLGPNINTADWDSEFSITADGTTGYMTTGAYGKDANIYQVVIESSERPKPVAKVFGKVRHQETDAPIPATIRYTELTDKANTISAQADEDGSYQIFLPAERLYSYTAEQEGFFAVSEPLDLRKLDAYTAIEHDIYLVPIAVGNKIQLNNLFFQQSKADLLPQSTPELKRLYQLLKENPGLRIKIIGHTDNVGNPFKNRVLSFERANKVRDYLTQAGIATNRIQTEGKGGDEPLNDNSTETLRQQNRRVEFLILQK